MHVHMACAACRCRNWNLDELDAFETKAAKAHQAFKPIDQARASSVSERFGDQNLGERPANCLNLPACFIVSERG